MKKAVLYIIGFATLAIYILAGNSRFMRFYLTDWDNSRRPAPLNWDRYKYGDLYGLSYLTEFKTPLADDVDPVGDHVPANAPNDLWLIGDSFLEGKLDPASDRSVLRNTRTRYFWWDNKDREPKLVTFAAGKRNILIIEIAERFVRDTYLNTESVSNLARHYKTKADEVPPTAPPLPNAVAFQPPRKPGIFEKRLVPESFSQNAEALLFGYEFLAPLKNAKAEMNYRLLSRVPPTVAVSSNTGSNPAPHLFFAETVDQSKNTSSFKPLSDAEVSAIVQNMNFVADAYRSKGFDEVFFSIIPNPVTIVEPDRGTYNELIPRVDNSPEMRAGIIDIYSPMKAAADPASLYRGGDTHWNARGYGIWIAEANRVLERGTQVRK